MRKVLLFILAIFVIHELFFVSSFSTFHLSKTNRADGLRLDGVSTYHFIDNKVFQKWDNFTQFYDDCTVKNKNNWVCEKNSFGAINGDYFNKLRGPEYETVGKLEYAREHGKWAKISNEGLQYVWPLVFLAAWAIPARYR